MSKSICAQVSSQSTLWTRDDADAAWGEGWYLSHAHDIRAINPNEWSHMRALQFVRERAAAGSKLHERALIRMLTHRLMC